jgi:cyclopropane-fatty-acyl-phospholipid synthase
VSSTTSTQPHPRAVPEAAASSRPVGAFERWLLRRVLAARGSPRVELVLWTGERFGVPASEALARVEIRDPATLRALVLQPESGFGDAYAEGRLRVVGDLPALLESGFRVGRPRGVEWRLAAFASRWLQRNTRRKARGHVQHHYDLGNDFYARWLDERMVYTCAYFPTPDVSLEEAQVAKLDHVCRKLRLRPGERVVEAGCGWGALALHMAAAYGCRVRAFNVSKEQVAWSRERAKERGLVGRVEFVEDDYRNVSGRYDAFVSVGMLEHVGRSHYQTLGRVIDRSLTPDGRAFLHSIGRARPAPLNPWVETNIFPGAYTPTLREMIQILEGHDFAVLDVENLRLHYARTLQHWLVRFERHADAFTERFDERFVRMWRLYLAGSIAGFRAGSLQLFQVLSVRTGSARLPWTRAHVYEAP